MTTARSETSGTVRAFRLLGVPVRLHFTFILLLMFPQLALYLPNTMYN